MFIGSTCVSDQNHGTRIPAIESRRGSLHSTPLASKLCVLACVSVPAPSVAGSCNGGSFVCRPPSLSYTACEVELLAVCAQVEGTLRLGFTYLPHAPYIRALRVGFVTMPAFRISIKPMSASGVNVTELPVIDMWCVPPRLAPSPPTSECAGHRVRDNILREGRLVITEDYAGWPSG